MADSPPRPHVHTLLDEEILTDLREDFASTDDLDQLAGLIEGFLGRVSGQVARIAESVATGDPDLIHASAHKLKGSSRTLGASLVGAIAEAIEHAGDAGDVLAARRLLPELDVAVTLSRGALGDLVEALGGPAGDHVVRTPSTDGDTLSVLLADDEATQLAVLRASVEAMGHITTVATDGLEALGAYAQGRFDIVMADWHMPGIDGIELAERIRARDGAAPYIVIVSASGDRAAAMGSRVDAVLQKPVDANELRAVLALAARRVA
jgi:CheY-like chemotaxis protein